ncbi:MFS transporter [Acidaminobacter sp. JC074]|uniref:MFS transporter n=1 Tax=Acidaminobacter sp. JC074 TaxID=2530199 RepID=UPI001F112BED|nr:MFS transporter [Acidaminobacter sp. JC074]MCH4890034.1 MFS transporter [Acidaminobacter sp. JC074]
MNIKISKYINEKFFYGWMIILVAGMSVFFSAPGQSYSISTFMKSYTSDFGLSQTLISSIYSIATVCSGLLLVFVGRAVDKHGQRKMTIIVGIALAIVCFFNSFISNIVMIAISFFLLRYLGQGSLTLIPNSLTPQWFEKRRALSISLMNLGGMIANLIVPVINVYLINLYSWQHVWRLWSLAVIVIFIPLSYLFIVNKPEDIGALPDNEKALDDYENNVQTENAWTLDQALKTKEFWFVGIISMIVPMISTGLVIHFFKIMDLKGISETQASFVIGLMALPGFIMPLVSGLIIDRFRSKYIITFTLVAITLCLLLFINVASVATAVIFMLLYGLVTNVQTVTISVIWPRYFGRKYLGSIRGAATIFMVIGSALGPIPFGLSYDLTGGYNAVLIAMMAITLLSTLMALSIQKPSKSGLM